MLFAAGTSEGTLSATGTLPAAGTPFTAGTPSTAGTLSTVELAESIVELPGLSAWVGTVTPHRVSGKTRAGGRTDRLFQLHALRAIARFLFTCDVFSGLYSIMHLIDTDP